MADETPAAVAERGLDDNDIRFWIGIAWHIQFVAIMALMVACAFWHVDFPVPPSTVFVAEIGLGTVVYTFYYGSSSGSVAKSATLEKLMKP